MMDRTHRETPADRTRALILTDICNEPDDEQSLVRLLLYANEIEIEGLVATTSCWLREGPREDVIRETLAAYGQVRDNLLRHARGYPAQAALEAVACTGQTAYSMDAVGDGRSTPGSRRILAATDRDDPRPLWICVWGGANTLAQALWDARRERSEDDLARLVSKLRVYAISDQDHAGPWLRREFPGLFYIVSPSNPDEKSYHQATWSGISGDRFVRNGSCHRFDLVDNPWLDEHVRNGHGPLGARYPQTLYIMEGDTPSYLGLIRNGLGWHVSPDFGGWGGRYRLYQAYGETRPIWTNTRDSRDTVVAEDGRTYTSDQATIWRWREHYQHDFAARMDWCVAGEYGRANHNPHAVLNEDKSQRILYLSARSGETVTLSAAGSSDPDGDEIRPTWFVYREAGTYDGDVPLSDAAGFETQLTAPPVSHPQTIHIILQVEDNGAPPLVSYRRAIVTVMP